MSSVAITFDGPRMVGFVKEEDRPLAPTEVRLRTLYSGVSTGTELTAYRGTNPYLHKRWDTARRLFVRDAEHEPLAYPLKGWGYEECGQVVEIGSDIGDVRVGSIVYGAWGHRTHHIAPASYVRDRVLPVGVDPLLGIFSQIGAIALNGVLDAAIRLGETVAVFGLGVVGQLVAQLAGLSGAEVIAVDFLPLRLDVARRVGIGHVLDGSGSSAAERIKEMTGGRGADVCIESAGSTAALNEAVRACAYASKVVAMGFFQGEATGLSLGEEFHHNRINIVCSQISGVSPELQHRWDSLRLAQTFMRLVAQDRLQLRPLITHVVPASEAPDLFRLLDERPTEALQTVLDFRNGLPLAQVEGRT